MPNDFRTAESWNRIESTAAALPRAGTRHRVLGWYRFWRDLGYPAGALVAGVVGGLFGLGSAVMVGAGLTLASGLLAASLMKPRQAAIMEVNDDRHLHHVPRPAREDGGL